MRQKKWLHVAIGLLLATVMLCGTCMTAFAETLNTTYGLSEVKNATAFTGTSKKIFDWKQLDPDNASYVKDHWVEKQGGYASHLAEMGVLYAVGQQAGQYKILIDDKISTRDAMTLATLYYWSSYSSGYRVAQGAKGTGLAARANSYSNIQALFPVKGLNIVASDYQGISREYAFYVIASCVSKKTGVQLSEYSGTELGYLSSKVKSQLEMFNLILTAH